MQIRKFLSLVMALYVVLGIWKGYVALYDEGAAEPRQIYPCKAASLPLADQQALSAGILIRNDRDLQRLLEDYLS